MGVVAQKTLRFFDSHFRLFDENVQNPLNRYLIPFR